MNLTFLLLWLLEDPVKKGVEAIILSKCAWGQRCDKFGCCDVSIQLKKIKLIRLWTVVKTGRRNLNITFLFWMAAC